MVSQSLEVLCWCAGACCTGTLKDTASQVLGRFPQTDRGPGGGARFPGPWATTNRSRPGHVLRCRLLP